MGIARVKTNYYPLATSTKATSTSVLHRGEYVSRRDNYFIAANRILIGREYDGALSSRDLVVGVRCKKVTSKKFQHGEEKTKLMAQERILDTRYYARPPRWPLLFTLNAFGFSLHNISKTRR